MQAPTAREGHGPRPQRCPGPVPTALRPQDAALNNRVGKIRGKPDKITLFSQMTTSALLTKYQESYFIYVWNIKEKEEIEQTWTQTTDGVTRAEGGAGGRTGAGRHRRGDGERGFGC